MSLWGRDVEIYANANLSIYSGQSCNAKCPFCVEELRPASRGRTFVKNVEPDDRKYFAAMENTLTALRPLDPSVSVTGGEPSLDPRLPRILATLAEHGMRKRTMTTNGSGLLESRDGRRVADWIARTGVSHLNISRAHPDHERNAELMRFDGGLSNLQLREVVETCGARVRLSCVLLKGEIDSLEGIEEYLAFARSAGIDNVIFRQLMKTDPTTVEPNYVVRYSDRKRVALEPILDEVSRAPRFTFQRQIMGYYYYVEVWRFGEMDVVFEEADLAHLEAVKRAQTGVIHELVFHPHGRLCSTWQPWDGDLGSG